MRCERCGAEIGDDLQGQESRRPTKPLPRYLWILAILVIILVAAMALTEVSRILLAGISFMLVVLLGGLARWEDRRRDAFNRQMLCADCAGLASDPVVTTAPPATATWVAMIAYLCLALCAVGLLFQFALALVLGLVGIALLICGLSDGVTALLDAGRAHDGAKAAAARGGIALNGLGCLGAVLLLVILLPGPHYPREHAKKTKTLNNIKQLAIATLTYSEDYGGALPGWVRNPDGRFAHNTWDEQINPQVKAKDVFNNGDTGIRSYSDPNHQRVLTYGLNALLITPPKATFDGNADFQSVTAKNPPHPIHIKSLNSPATTILFAELSTSSPMPGRYGHAPDPKPLTWQPGNGSAQWQGALTGWIDISPRAFIEIVRGNGNDPYNYPYGKDADSGIARDFYGGGGVYGFCDGHAQFMKIGKSVGLGTTIGKTVITEKNCWSPHNTNNVWNPQ